jgi:hypothetical protein
LVAQLRVISRSALRPGPERLDAALLRRAARDDLALIRPMLAPLRGGAPPPQATLPVAETLCRNEDAQDLRGIAQGRDAYAALGVAKFITPPADDPLVVDPALERFRASDR